MKAFKVGLLFNGIGWVCFLAGLVWPPLSWVALGLFIASVLPLAWDFDEK